MDAATAARLVECPVCLDVPANPIVFICVNGHSVCSRCKKQLKKCPIASCRYTRPPTRNRMVEEFISKASIHSCMNADEGCGFTGTRDRVFEHEDECSFNEVVCPKCGQAVRLFSLVAHIRNQHPRVTWADLDSVDGGMIGLRIWNPEQRQGPNSIMGFTREGETFLITLSFKEGIFYIWVYIINSSDAADSFRCQIEVYNTQGDSSAKSTCEVHSINETANEVRTDDDCFQLTARTARKLLDDQQNLAIKLRIYRK